MRKIISYEEKEKKLKRNQFIIGFILILLMVFSTLGFAFSSRSTENSIEKVEYNGIEFFRDPNLNNHWSFQINDKNFLTLHNPNDTQDISFFTSNNLNKYSNKPLYFAGDTGEQVFELSRNLIDVVQRMSNACLDECEEDYPVKNCSQDNVIVFKDSLEKNLIYQEGNCVYITTNPANQTRYADAYLFRLLGID